MAHLITCPECDKHLQVPEDLVGRQVQCPECQHRFIAAVAQEQEPSKAKTPNETDEPAAWDKRSTRAGVSKKTSRRSYDDDDDDYGDRRRGDDDDDDLDVRRNGPSARRDGGSDKPGHVTGIGVMALIGGIWAIMLFLGLIGGSGLVCCLWPGSYYSVVVGILAIIKGSSILGNQAYVNTPPTGIAVMMIINIINGDVVNLVLGILILVFCGDEEVKAYFAR